MARVRIVLVRPENPVNVGAVARVIRNCGLEGLDLVAPGDWRTVECWRTAWGAHDVLERARVFAEAPPALAGAAYVAALSGRPQHTEGWLDVRDLAAEVASLDGDEPACLVFGPETSGLTREEMALCGRRGFIPSHPDQPSLNLSHAAMVTGYEVFRAGSRPRSGPRPAAHDEKERMLTLLRQGLLTIEALPRSGTDGYFQEWRALFQRNDLTPKEVRLLEHMARKMSQAAPAPSRPRALE